MELNELQNNWNQYDLKISESIRINKEILRKILIFKPEKRVSRIKIKALINIILPLIVVIFFLIFGINYRDTLDFYFGLGTFLILGTVSFFWTIKYYFMISKIDFSKPVLTIKKEIKELEKYKITTSRLAYFFAPFAMIGIFLAAQIPVFSKNSFLFLSLIILLMAFSIYYNFKYSISERFKKLNLEIDEIQQLENETESISRI